MEKTLILLLAFGVLLTACTHCPETSEVPTQQMGDFSFWAECGECFPLTDTFLLHDANLFNETGQALPDSLFQLAKSLQTDMPAVLCDSIKEIYGCGSCYDGISYFVKTECNGQERTWQFDPYQSAGIPPEVNAYAKQVMMVYDKCAQ